MTWGYGFFHTITIIARTAVAIRHGQLGYILWRIRQKDGPIIDRFSDFFFGNCSAMYWYIVASLMSAFGVKDYLPFMWEHAWVVWIPLFIVTERLRKQIRRHTEPADG